MKGMVSVAAEHRSAGMLSVASRLSLTALAFCYLATLPACSTVRRFVEPSRKVELSSSPAGAEVQTLQGDVLGKTPMVIEGPLLEKASQNGRLAVVLSFPGYVNRELLLDVGGTDTHEIVLSKLDDTYFSNRLLKDYAQQNNVMIRELLGIQGLLILKKLDEAQRSLEGFTRRYPSVAAGYVMMANISQMRGQRAAAKGFLLRAQELDPEDPVIVRMLKGSRQNQ